MTEPQISEETKKKMLEFFMQTSIPRLIEKEVQENESIKSTV